MNISIIDTPLHIELYGLSGHVENYTYGPTGQRLMQQMDAKMKAGSYTPSGDCMWIYEEGEMIFTGFVFASALPAESGLEHKVVDLPRYALYKHIGPYEQLGQIHDELSKELEARGIERLYPSLERYIVWNTDPSKLETEVITNIGQ